MRRAAVLLAALVALSVGGAGAPALDRATAVIETDRGSIRVAVEIADSPSERRRGLMHRRSLAPDAGMLFLFERDTRGGFWMKDTRIPLSIAFVDRRGRIARILDMTPCLRDPCRTYYPGVTYRSALEVNRGAFRRWGVAVGDTVKLRR